MNRLPLSKPLLSVIIPVFNTPSELLEKAVVSLLQQTLNDIEIILVDDGSTDASTLGALQSWKEKGITVVRKENNGLAAARNYGLRFAHGNLISYLDSDDWVDPEFYVALCHRLESDMSDIACGSIVLESSDSVTDFDIQTDGVAVSMMEKFGHFKNGSCCNKVFRRELLRLDSFPEGRYYEDNLVMVEVLMKAKRVSYVADVRYHYYQHEKSTIHSKDTELKRLEDIVFIAQSIRQMTQDLPAEVASLIMNRLYDAVIPALPVASYPGSIPQLEQTFGVKIRNSRPSENMFERICSLRNSANRSYKILSLLGKQWRFPRKRKATDASFEPFVSIIVASYNYRQFIGETFDSLLTQTYTNYEIVVVDDGSTDGSVELISQYALKHPCIRLFMHKNGKNRGLVETLKLGVSKSRGEYVAFCESDDYWTENHLEEVVRMIGDNCNVALISNGITCFGDESSVKARQAYVDDVDRRLKPGRNHINLKKHQNRQYIPTFSSVAIRWEVLATLDFDCPVPAWIDFWLYRQIQKRFPLYYVKKKLTFWRQHESYNGEQAQGDYEKKMRIFLKESNRILGL